MPLMRNRSNTDNQSTMGFRWRLIKRALFYKRAKVLLILVAVAMGSSVITALINLENDLRYRMNRELRDYGPNVLVIPGAGQRYLDQRTFDSLKSRVTKDEVTELAPQLFLPVRIQEFPAVLVGTDLSALRRLYPGWSWSVAGQDFDPPIFLGVRLARKLKAEPGNDLRIEANGKLLSFKVAGLIEGGESEDDRAFCELSAAQQLSELNGMYHTIALSALGTIPEVQGRFANLIKSYPGVEFQLIHKIAVTETVILDKISRLMGLVISIIIVILFFCINTTVSAVLLARQREIALFRVLGARRKQIMAGLTLELLILGFAGGLSGFVLGIFMAQILGKLLFQTYIMPHWSVFVITIVSSLALMVISSFLPIRKAINRQAAVVLKEI